MTYSKSSPHEQSIPPITDAKFDADAVYEPHTLNVLYLPNDDQLPEEFVQILRRLDADFETIAELEVEAIGRTLDEASKRESWGPDTANKMMKWVYHEHPHIKTEDVHQFFPRMALSDHIEVRQYLVDEADAQFREFLLLWLKEMPYGDYLKTPHWKRVRKGAIEAAGFRCQLCNADAPLHVHHRTYERRGEEWPSDVIALCAECHEHFHNGRKVARP